MIRQLLYTSCRRGRDGIHGFQVAAATPGIAGRHENLGLPLAAYRPPPAAAPVPSAAEITALPVALGFRDFGDVAVLFRSHYLGEDFTGRQGNYFAHVLLADAPAADLGGLPPAAAWEAAFWTCGPQPETADTALPPCPGLGSLLERAGADGAGSAARAWLVGRDAEYAELLGAVREALAGRVRQVVVVAPGPDPAGQVAAAVLAVTAPLPAALAQRVSFTTFSAAPADVDLMVVGTTPDALLGAGRGRVLVRWGEQVPQAPSGFAELALRAWRAGPQAVADLRALAVEVDRLDTDELDAFAAATWLINPPDLGAPVDPLPGLEFLMGRHPGRLDADVWALVEQGVAAGTVEVGDLAGWSAVLRGTRGHRPLLEAAYCRAVLGHVAAGGRAEHLWLPAVGRDRSDAVAAWATAVVEADPAPATVVRVLDALHRLDIDPPENDLRTIADLVLLPLVLDPAGDVGPIRSLPGARRLAGVMTGLLEERLDDDLIGTAAQSMSADAARWLAGSAAGGSRVALVTALRLASVGERDAVDLVLRHAVDAAALDRLAALVWPGPPPAADGVRLLTRLDPAVGSPSGALLDRLADRLVLDSGGDRAEPGLGELARALDRLRPELPDAARPKVDAVLLTDWFHHHRVTAPEARAQLVAAAEVTGCAEPALAGPLARALVNWLFGGGEVLAHADALEAVHRVGATAVLPVYEQRLLRTLDAADPDAILAVLPAIVHVAPAWSAVTDLLDGPCAAMLGRRRRKTLDDLGARLSERGSVPEELRPGRAANWTAWWKHYRETRLTPEQGLRGRILRFGRGS